MPSGRDGHLYSSYALVEQAWRSGLSFLQPQDPKNCTIHIYGGMLGTEYIDLTNMRKACQQIKEYAQVFFNETLVCIKWHSALFPRTEQGCIYIFVQKMSFTRGRPQYSTSTLRKKSSFLLHLFPLEVVLKNWGPSKAAFCDHLCTSESITQPSMKPYQWNYQCDIWVPLRKKAKNAISIQCFGIKALYNQSSFNHSKNSRTVLFNELQYNEKIIMCSLNCLSSFSIIGLSSCLHSYQSQLTAVYFH